MEAILKQLVHNSLNPQPEGTPIEFKYLDSKEKEIIGDEETLQKLLEYVKPCFKNPQSDIYEQLAKKLGLKETEVENKWVNEKGEFFILTHLGFKRIISSS